MKISGWEWRDVHLMSPNGQYLAEVRGLREFGMGSPTIGTLYVNEKQIIDSETDDLEESAIMVSPSIVWSDDSQFLGLQVWKSDSRNVRYTKTAIYDISNDNLHRLKSTSINGYELTNFANGILSHGSQKIHVYDELNIKSSIEDSGGQ